MFEIPFIHNILYKYEQSEVFDIKRFINIGKNVQRQMEGKEQISLHDAYTTNLTFFSTSRKYNKNTVIIAILSNILI